MKDNVNDLFSFYLISIEEIMAKSGALTCQEEVFTESCKKLRNIEKRGVITYKSTHQDVLPQSC